MTNDIKKYHESQDAVSKAICDKLFTVISKELTKAENKMWHGSPVWFIEGNPIVAYSVLKKGVQILFWSGQSFKDTELIPQGSFKASEFYFTKLADIKVTAVRGWLKQAKKIQWDYKNIVKNKGKLSKIGNW